jgi:hypothetical protein
VGRGRRPPGWPLLSSESIRRLARRCPLDDLSHTGSTAPGDAKTGTGGSAKPGSGFPPPSPPGGPPGLRQQIGATRAALVALARAHVELAKAEFGDIIDEVKRMAVAAGIAFGALLFIGLLVPVGGTLFLGEWLFGSIGWGVLLGTELAIAVAIVAVASVIGVTRQDVTRAFGAAVVTGVVVGLVLGLDLTNTAWTRLGENVAQGIPESTRPLAVAAVVLAAIGGLIGFILGARGGAGGAIAGLFGGAVVGAILGAVSALAWGPRAGAAAGVAVGLAVWPIVVGLSLARTGVDVEGIKSRLWPTETIQTTRETIEWVRAQTPLGPKS